MIYVLVHFLSADRHSSDIFTNGHDFVQLLPLGYKQAKMVLVTKLIGQRFVPFLLGVKHGVSGCYLKPSAHMSDHFVTRTME